MAYVFNPEKQQDKNTSQGSTVTQGTTPQGTGVISGGQGPVQARPTSSGRFTNIQNYLSANRQSKLGQNVQQNIQGQAGKTQADIAKEREEFQAKTTQAMQPFQGGQQFAQQAIQGAGTAPLSEADMQRFQQLREGQYGGPQDFQNYSTLAQNVQNVRNLAGLANTESGRFALLKNVFGGGPQYGRGAQTLDSLILQNQRPQIQGMKSVANQAFQQLQSSRTAAQQQAQQNAELAKQTSQDVQSQLGQAQSQTQGAVDTAFTAAQAAEAERQKNLSEMRGLFSGSGAKSGQEELDDVNKALTIAQQMGLTQGKDIENIQALYQRLNTPVNQVSQYAVKSGSGGFLGYGDSGGAQVQRVSAPVTGSLKIGDVLGQALATKDVQNLTKEGIATPEQRARLNALLRLSGKDTSGGYNEQADKYQKGTQAFDLDAAQKRVNDYLANLAQTQQLSDIYQDVPLIEKLRRTAAPTGQEWGKDVNQDYANAAEDLTSGRVVSGGADLAKTALEPGRLLAGTTIAAAQPALAGLKDITSGNELAGTAKVAATPVASQVLAPLNVANAGLSLASNAPVIGSVLKPIAAPVSAVTNTVSHAVGTVICTELHRQGYINSDIIQKDAEYGNWIRKTDPLVYHGYIAWAPSVVKLMRKSSIITSIVKPFALAFANQIAGKPSLLGKFVIGVGQPLCRLIGKFKTKSEYLTE